MIEVQATLTPHTLQNRIQVGVHELITDVPADLGGTDTGPQPHDLLSAALAACTSTTVQMYAQRKNWPLEQIQVRVSAKKEGEIETFYRFISLKGSLDQEQQNRLLEIANKCPVHKILSGQTQVVTETL